MALYNTLPFIQLQLNLRWPPDMPSFLLGLVLGILLTVAFFYWLPTLRLWRGRAVARGRQTLAWFRSGAEVRYQAETAEYLTQHHLGQQWGQLADIVTLPRLLLPTSEVDPQTIAQWHTNQLARVWPELAARVALPPLPGVGLQSLLANGQRVVISAPAGGGKTTLLAYSAYLCATSKEQPLPSVVPAYLHLAELDVSPYTPIESAETAETPEPPDPLVPLVTALQRCLSPLTARGLKALFQRKLKAGQVLLLLDGWDELPPSARKPYLAWLMQFLELYPVGRIVIGVGLTGYGRLLDVGFTYTQILPWRQREIEAFAAGWAVALNNNPLRFDRYWRPGMTPLETSLRFWLTSLNGQTNAAQKPHRQVDLLAQALPLFCSSVEGWEEEEATKTALLHFWQRLAHHMLVTEQLLLSKEELARLALEAADGQDVKEWAARLQKSVQKCQLFIPVKGIGFRFRSLIWRDYLAAVYLARLHDLKAVQAALKNPYWQRVVCYYVAQPEIPSTVIGQLANALLQAADRTPTRKELFQVAAWLPELEEGMGDWQRQVLVLLGQIVRQTSFPRLLRQRAAATLAQTGEQGVFTFATQLLDRSDSFLRQMGVMALSCLGLQRPQEVIRRLVDCLNDGAADVRLASVQALAWLPHPLTEESLLTALINGDDDVSRAVAEGLALRGSEGLAFLQEALVDEAVHVRRAAVYGLLMATNAQVIPWLEKVEREDKEWLIRSASTEVLEMIQARQKLAWTPLDLRQQRWLVEFAAHDGRAVPGGAAALPFLVQVLSEATQPKMRAAAAVSLGLLPAYKVIPALETAVRDDSGQVSEAAFGALCTIRRAYELP